MELISVSGSSNDFSTSLARAFLPEARIGVLLQYEQRGVDWLKHEDGLRKLGGQASGAPSRSS